MRLVLAQAVGSGQSGECTIRIEVDWEGGSDVLSRGSESCRDTPKAEGYARALYLVVWMCRFEAKPVCWSPSMTGARSLKV